GRDCLVQSRSVFTGTKSDMSIPDTAGYAPATTPRVSSISKTRARRGESVIKFWLRFCSAISILTTLAIVVLLLTESYDFFQVVPPTEFFFGTRWVPLLQPQSFGVLPLVWGTLMITFGAALIAIPLGLASAIYLSEYASARVRAVVKPVLELLAGIPTVVYGYF